MFLALFKQNNIHGNSRIMVSLYRNPIIVSCVFRALEDLSKIIVLRMACGHITLQENMMKLMVNEGKERQLNISLRQLQQLSILEKKNHDTYSINEKFRISLQKYITDSMELPSVPLPSNFQQEQSTPLHYLLEQPPTPFIKEILIRSNLITSDLKPTKDGFGFFLYDLSTQICLIMNSIAQSQGPEIWEQIIEISTLELERAYVSSRWDPHIIKTLATIKFITLLTTDNKEYIKVNRVFRNFCFSQPDVDLSLKCDIIVETNFNIYAHIKPTKHRKNYEIIRRVLAQFVKLKHQDVNFQELIVGTLSKDSVKRAYETGITADQILQFFRKHTDPKRLEEAEKKGQIVNKNDVIYNEKREKLKFLKIYSKQERDIIPNNVIQQLKLWESAADGFGSDSDADSNS